ncbi:MAG: hypothetical protein MAG453_00097 [Calditrichaeota bacterium]|nr:hypothetical protein [Calditrichota bacterium]
MWNVWCARSRTTVCLPLMLTLSSCASQMPYQCEIKSSGPVADDARRMTSVLAVVHVPSSLRDIARILNYDLGYVFQEEGVEFSELIDDGVLLESEINARIEEMNPSYVLEVNLPRLMVNDQSQVTGGSPSFRLVDIHQRSLTVWRSVVSWEQETYAKQEDVI